MSHEVKSPALTLRSVKLGGEKPLEDSEENDDKEMTNLSEK